MKPNARTFEMNSEDGYNFEGTEFDSYGFCPDKPENLGTSQPSKWMDHPRMLEFTQKSGFVPAAKSSLPQVQHEFAGLNLEYMLRPGLYFAILIELPEKVTGVISQDKVP